MTRPSAEYRAQLRARWIAGNVEGGMPWLDLRRLEGEITAIAKYLLDDADALDATRAALAERDGELARLRAEVARLEAARKDTTTSDALLDEIDRLSAEVAALKGAADAV